MLAECREHGFFRGECCPVCCGKGKFLMSDREVDSLGRIMAGVLRHFPDKLGLMMDGHGWVDINDFINAIGVSRSGFHWLRDAHIEAIVLTDLKGRYEIDGGMVRATYGHSLDVNLDDLPIADLEWYYYPVTEEELDIILEGGLRPVDRSKVHLSGSIEKALEAGHIRTEEPLLLKINGMMAKEDGLMIYKAGKDVYVTNQVDAKYLSKVDVEEIKKKAAVNDTG